MTEKKSKVGGLYPTKGLSIEGLTIMKWDAIRPCNPPMCPVEKECPYMKVGKCRIEILYLRPIFNRILSEKEGLGGELTPLDLQRIGYHLIPLYHQLIRLKKELYAVSRLAKPTSRGVIRMNPLPKEIREVLRAISREMSDMRLQERWTEKFKKKSVSPDEGLSVDLEELLEHGDPNYHDELEAMDEKEDEYGPPGEDE